MKAISKSDLNLTLFGGRTGARVGWFLALCLAVITGHPAARAQGVIAASATLSGTDVGGGEYAYTLTLKNAASSTTPIALFWFAWIGGGASFMSSLPTAIQTPAGWTSVVDGGGDADGYSIQFATHTSPLRPGSSVTFNFLSPDSPALMAGPAVLYPDYPTLSSQVYSGVTGYGVQDVFTAQVVQPAPEPSTWFLLGVGLLTLGLVQRRNRKD